jgi:type I restriction enzyme S subunit
VKIESGEVQNLVQKGDLLFLMSSEDFDGVGKPAIMEEQVENLGLNSFCKGMRVTNSETNSKYLFYLLSSHLLRELVRQEAKGFIRINLRQDRLSCCPVFLPSLTEQQKIADYLDKVCGEVDEMVALQETMIEELKAYKQSVITEAVTKGLNPNVPMRDSGIDWIGEIPEHWEQHQFRRIFEMKKIIAGTLGYDVLSVTQDGIKVIDLTKNEGQIAQDYSKYQLVDVDDYVMNHMDLLTGYVDCSRQNGVTSPDYRVFRAIDKSKISLAYYLKIFQTCYKEKIFYHLGQGVSGMGRWRLPAEQLKLFVLPMPPLSEQQQIASYLDNKCSEIDSLIALKQAKIEELKEYKKSVIYEYVTGKKEVV